MIIKALSYTLKVWLTSIVIGPVLHLLINCFTATKMGYAQIGIVSSLYFILMSIPFGIILSIPSFLLLWLSVYLLKKFDIDPLVSKISLSIISVILSAFAFFIVFGQDDPSTYKETTIWAFAYCSVIVGAIWYYEFAPKVLSV